MKLQRKGIITTQDKLKEKLEVIDTEQYINPSIEIDKTNQNFTSIVTVDKNTVHYTLKIRNISLSEALTDKFPSSSCTIGQKMQYYKKKGYNK